MSRAGTFKNVKNSLL